MMYTVEYSKKDCDDLNGVYSEFCWDYLADQLPYDIAEYIDYEKLVEERLELRLEELSESYLIMSETKFDSLRIE